MVPAAAHPVALRHWPLLALPGTAAGAPRALESRDLGMRISRAEFLGLGRRREQPTRQEDELLAVFVRGALVNPLNAHAWGWQKRSKLARQWKEAVATALLDAHYSGRY